MEKQCNFCECPDYCLGNGYCIGAAIKKKYDPNDWEKEMGDVRDVRLKQEVEINAVDVSPEILKAAIKG